MALVRSALLYFRRGYYRGLPSKQGMMDFDVLIWTDAKHKIYEHSTTSCPTSQIHELTGPG